jgi:UPF0716 protein FxsA
MALVLLFLFLLLPIAEIYVIVQVGQAIGIWRTLAILLLDGFVGAALARSQGRTAWARFNVALAEGRVPARETFDGAMIILGGAFLLAPGFITDAVGFLLLIPPTRALVRGGVAALARRRLAFAWTVASPPPRGAPGPGRPRPDPFQPPRDPAGSYDYEGTAREVNDTSAELPPGERRE